MTEERLIAGISVTHGGAPDGQELPGLIEKRRKWIEDKIALTPDITYYNMSRVGARIAGTQETGFMGK